MKGEEINPSEKATKVLKDKFRSRKVWKDFCDEFRELKGNRCAICDKQLTKVIGNVHHLHSNPTMGDYMNLDKSRFLLLCTNCHEWCHAVANSPRLKYLGLANRKSDKVYLEPEQVFKEMEIITTKIVTY